MRPAILSIVLLFAELSFSQSSADTIVQKRQLDSIEYVVYKLKDSLRRIQYENDVLVNCHSIDTSKYGSDSVVIKYKSKSGKSIKIFTREGYQSDGLYNYEKVEYFNKLQLPEFVEHWEQARSMREDSSIIQWKVYSYDRFNYDSSGKVTAWIKFYPDVSRRTVRRCDYFYGLDGTKTSTTYRVKVEKFWD